MAAKHAALPATFEADDGIPSHGSPDRNRGSALWSYHFRWGAETPQCLMDGLDQRRELIGRDLVPSHIRGDHFCREFPIDPAGRLLVWHRLALPFFEPRDTIPEFPARHAS